MERRGKRTSFTRPWRHRSDFRTPGQSYESYLLPYKENNIALKIKHMVQGQPRDRVVLFYYYRSHLQDSRNYTIFYSWHLKVGTISCPETSIRNYHCSLRDIAKEKCFHRVWVSSNDKVFVKSFVNTCKHFSRLKYKRSRKTKLKCRNLMLFSI